MVAKYVGMPPQAGPLTDEGIDRVRSQHPDDPIKLPTGHLACEGCGVAANDEVVVSLPVGGGKFTVHYGRCQDCQRLHDRAGGNFRVKTVLYALAVIGQPAPADPLPLVPWMQTVGNVVSWADPDAPTPEWCSPHPWAHVSLRQRAQIREAYLLAMRHRVRLGASPMQLPPPWGGACLSCGVGTLSMTPIEVVRGGGRERAAHSIWRHIQIPPTALGGHGPDLVDGFLCPPCADAVDKTGGVGVRARARAFEQYAREHRSEAEARRVASILNQCDNLVLPGWAALGATAPNSEPWAHIAVPLPELAS